MNEETWRAISFSDGSGWEEPWWTWRRLSGVLQGLLASLREQNSEITAAFIHFGVMDFFSFCFCLFLKSKKKEKKKMCQIWFLFWWNFFLFFSCCVFEHFTNSSLHVQLFKEKKENRKVFLSKNKNCKWYSYCMFL